MYHRLRRQKRRRKRYARDRHGQIVGLCPIDALPVAVDDRQTIGHWEGDTMLGKRHQGCLVAHNV